MGKQVKFVLTRDSEITAEEIAMLEAAESMPIVPDDENPEIDPIRTPELYAALLQAVGERNRRISRHRA